MPCGVARKTSVNIDDPTDEILRRVAPAGQAAAYIRTAIIEKAARDEQRDVIADLLARVGALEAELERLKRP